MDYLIFLFLHSGNQRKAQKKKLRAEERAGGRLEIRPIGRTQANNHEDDNDKIRLKYIGILEIYFNIQSYDFF